MVTISAEHNGGFDNMTKEQALAYINMPADQRPEVHRASQPDKTEVQITEVTDRVARLEDELRKMGRRSDRYSYSDR